MSDDLWREVPEEERVKVFVSRQPIPGKKSYAPDPKPVKKPKKGKK